MKGRGILTVLVVLLFLGAGIGLSRLGSLQGGFTAPPGAAQPKTPPPAKTTTITSAARCRAAAGDVEPIVVREQPSPKSVVIARVGAADQALTRLNARAVKGGDWIQVRLGERTGWADGAEVICRLAPDEAQQVIAPVASQVLSALGTRNMRELATHVHPVKGLRFSPTVDVDPERSIVFTASELAKGLDDPRHRRWGSSDGSGEPISLSFADYYGRFVWDRDYARAAEKRYNEFGAKSTTRPNLWEVYPNAVVVESHVPGTKPESEGMDWKSLLLVFEQHDSTWYLSAIVHDQWSV